MKQMKKLFFIFVFIFIFCTTNIFGTTIHLVAAATVGDAPSPLSSVLSYYKFDGDFLDATPNNIDGSCTNCPTLITGIINESYSYDGINDKVDLGQQGDGETLFSVNVWVKGSSFTNLDAVVSKWGASTDFSWQVNLLSTGTTRFNINANVHAFPESTTLIDDDAWHMITGVYDGSNANIYIDGNFEASSAVTGSIVDSTIDVSVGYIARTDLYADIDVDELSMYDIVLNQSNIDYLYQNGTPNSEQQYNFTSIPTPSPVPQITSNIQPYYTTENITINVNTTSNVNMSYILNSGIETSICNNCNLSSFNLFNLTEGITNNISLISEVSGINNTNNETFIYDGTNPSLIVNLPTEYTFYNNFNLSNYINVSGTNTCIVNISGESTTTCYEEYYNFTTNGNKIINVTATDLAGNTNSSLNNTLLINPIQYFNFQLSNGTAITNFTFGGVDFNDTASFTVYNDILILGSNTLLFERNGFASENFTFEINLTSALNNTYNVTQAQITVNIFDRQTGDPLLNLVNINILNLGNKSTSNGTAIFQDFNFLPSTYHVEASSEGYYTAEQDFIYTGESNAIVNMYLLDATFNGSTTLIVPVIDEFFNVIQGADTRLLEYDTSIFGFREVASCLTNSNGECKFLIEVSTKTYIVTTTKEIGGVIFSDQSSSKGEIFLPDISAGEEISGQIFLNNLVLKLSSTLPTPGTIGFIIDAPENTNATIVSKNSTATVINIPVSFTSQSGLSYTVCLEVYRKAGDNLVEAISPVCLTAASGIVPTVDITLNNDFDYQSRVTYEFDDHKTIYKTYLYPNNKSFVETILESGFVSPMIMFFWVILLSAALYLRNIGLWCWGAWTLSVTQLAIFANLLVASSSVIIIVINIGVFYISKRQVDTV